eukprot:gene12502-14772_t
MALGHAAGRSLELLQEFPTTVTEDLDILADIDAANDANEASLGNECEEDGEYALEYVAAVKYRITVKRLLLELIKSAGLLNVRPMKPL